MDNILRYLESKLKEFPEKSLSLLKSDPEEYYRQTYIREFLKSELKDREYDVIDEVIHES